MGDKSTVGPGDLANFQNQRKKLDDMRQSELTDVPLTRNQVNSLLDEREKGTFKESEAVLKYYYLYTKFPALFKSMSTYEKKRLVEAREICNLMLDKIEAVQKGQIDQYACSDIVEDNLARRFYKPK